MKVQALSNFAEYSKIVNLEEVSSSTFEEHVLKIVGIKYKLGLAYFVALSVLLTSLYI